MDSYIKRIRVVYDDGREEIVTKGGIYNMDGAPDFWKAGELECEFVDISGEEVKELFRDLLSSLVTVSEEIKEH